MLLILCVSPDKDSLSDLASTFAEHNDVGLLWAESSKKALEMASGKAIDLVITDEKIGETTGLKFASKLLSVNPMINCAAVSCLSPEKFHEVGEGLGLMAQLPERPGKEHAEELLKRLRHIKSLVVSVKDSIS